MLAIELSRCDNGEFYAEIEENEETVVFCAVSENLDELEENLRHFARGLGLRLPPSFS